MTPEKQRIAIAEACGWTEIDHVAIPWGYDEHHVWRGLPDYINDLNAMHEAEKLVVDDIEKCLSYQRNLRKTTDSEQYNITNSFVWHATAAQRAEAFLRTIGKWEES